jgi:hypothetical protein
MGARKFLLLVATIATSACRSEDMPPDDLSNVQDLSVGDGNFIDLSGIDQAQPPDLKNVDLYTPLFKTSVPYAAEIGPIYLATADLNKDGKRDLVVVNTNDPDGLDDDLSTVGDNVPSTVNILLGNGDGTFQTKLSTAIADYPFGVAIADVNNDTNPDIVVSVYNGYQVITNNGAATPALTVLTAVPIVGAAIRSIALGDIDGDGKLDIALSDLGAVTGKVWVGRGNNDGTFVTPVSYEVSLQTGGNARSPVAVRLGDMDNNGKIDVVTTNVTNDPAVNSISILTSSSMSGTIILSATPTEISTGKVPQDLLIAQLDGANKLDIVVANAGDNSVSVLLSDNAAATLTYGTAAKYTVGEGPSALAFADIDADSKVDIITADAIGSTVTVLYGGGGGVFGQVTTNRPGSETYSVGNNPISVVAATFNSDVKIDVATANQNAGNISVLINQR